MGIELNGRFVALGVSGFSLLGGSGLRVFLLPLVVLEPVVVGSVWSVLVVGAMDAWVVALPPVLGVLVVVWQGTALVVADELFLLNCQMLAAFRALKALESLTLLLWRRLLQARNVVGASTVVPQPVLFAGFFPAGLSGREVGEIVLLAPVALRAEDLAPDCLLWQR